MEKQFLPPRHAKESATGRTHAAFWMKLAAGLLLGTGVSGAGSGELPAADSASPILERHEFVQIRMGVAVRIVVYAPGKATAIHASDAAYARLKQLDQALSDYDPDSELNRLCRAMPPVDIPVSSDLWTVLQTAQALSAQTKGKFDVTVGPLVKLWRTARRRKELPAPKALALARERVGYQLLQLNADRQTITLRRNDMQLDLGGIAKGYGADMAYETLKAQGLPISLVAVAGDIRVGEPPPMRHGWNVQVERRAFDTSVDKSPLILELANCGISTSGDTYQFVTINNVRYSHIVDLETGYGLTTPASVTTVAPTAMEADGLCTALSILPNDQGLELLKAHPHTEALIVRSGKQGDSHSVSSPGWDHLPRVPASD